MYMYVASVCVFQTLKGIPMKKKEEVKKKKKKNGNYEKMGSVSDIFHCAEVHKLSEFSAADF